MSPLPANPGKAATQQTRRQMFWLLLGFLAASQLFAFWLLCSHQVRKAEARHNESVVQAMALSDCLQYIPGSTIASCAPRADATPIAAKPAVGAVPVSFNFNFR